MLCGKTFRSSAEHVSVPQKVAWRDAASNNEVRTSQRLFVDYSTALSSLLGHFEQHDYANTVLSMALAIGMASSLGRSVHPFFRPKDRQCILQPPGAFQYTDALVQHLMISMRAMPLENGARLGHQSQFRLHPVTASQSQIIGWNSSKMPRAKVRGFSVIQQPYHEAKKQVKS